MYAIVSLEGTQYVYPADVAGAFAQANSHAKRLELSTVVIDNGQVIKNQLGWTTKGGW